MASSWEEDIPGRNVLPDGDTQRVNLYNYRSPVFDIHLPDELRRGRCRVFYLSDIMVRSFNDDQVFVLG